MWLWYATATPERAMLWGGYRCQVFCNSFLKVIECDITVYFPEISVFPFLLKRSEGVAVDDQGISLLRSVYIDNWDKKPATDLVDAIVSLREKIKT